MFDVSSSVTTYSTPDLIAVILLGVLGGLLGALYNFLLDKILRYYSFINEYVASINPYYVCFCPKMNRLRPYGATAFVNLILFVFKLLHINPYKSGFLYTYLFKNVFLYKLCWRIIRFMCVILFAIRNFLLSRGFSDTKWMYKISWR